MKKVKKLKIIHINKLRKLFILKYLYIELYTLSIDNIITEIKGKIIYDNTLEYKIGKSII